MDRRPLRRLPTSRNGAPAHPARLRPPLTVAVGVFRGDRCCRPDGHGHRRRLDPYDGESRGSDRHRRGDRRLDGGDRRGFPWLREGETEEDSHRQDDQPHLSSGRASDRTRLEVVSRLHPGTVRPDVVGGLRGQTDGPDVRREGRLDSGECRQRRLVRRGEAAGPCRTRSASASDGRGGRSRTGTGAERADVAGTAGAGSEACRHDGTAAGPLVNIVGARSLSDLARMPSRALHCANDHPRPDRDRVRPILAAPPRVDAPATAHPSGVRRTPST